jgi:Sodium/hydrogen exchanger family/Universal stress protein family
VLVLLPVFFVIAGLNVNLRGIGLSGLVDLALIMLVAVAGKFGGAYYGARITGVRRRQSGALASLMNTRGLTEIVILTVGLQLGILSKALFTLMVVMAILTTGMAGPLLKVIYPVRIMERDIAEADRAALGTTAAHRILVLIDDPQTAGPLIEVAARLAASRPNSELVLSHLVPHRPAGRLEVGSGLGGELLQMTQTMARLKELAVQAGPPAVSATVQSRFSDDVSAELPAFVAAAGPDTIVLRRGTRDQRLLSADGVTQLVYVLRSLPASPTAAVARWARTADGEAAVQVAAQMSVASGVDLVLTPAGRPGTSLAASLVKRGLQARAGAPPAGAIVIAPADGVTGIAASAAGSAGAPGTASAGASDGDVHLAVVAGTKEASDDMDQWVQALDDRRVADSGLNDSSQSDSSQAGSRQADSSQRESRQP